MSLSAVVEHIIIMQFPVVAFLAITSLQAARTYGLRAYVSICAGWICNFLYLLSTNYNLLSSLSLPDIHIIPTSFSFLSSLLFYLGARDYAPLSSPLLLKHAKIWQIIAGAVIFQISVTVTRLAVPKNYSYFLLHAVPEVLYDMLAVAALALFYREFTKKQVIPYASIRHLYLACLLYVVIQPLYLFTEGLPQRTEDIVGAMGFFGGLAAKTGIFFGMTRLFAETAGRSRAQEARSYEIRRTVARIAHELNTPLAELQIQAEVLRKSGAVRGGYVGHLNDLEAAVARMVAIIDASGDLHLLETLISCGSSPQPLEGKKNTPSIERVNTLVETALMAVKETRDEDVKFAVSYAGNACIRCVGFEIIQVFINILRNSYDAFPDGQGKIWITTRNLDATNDRLEESMGRSVQIKVRDDGEGISKVDLPSIFEEGFSTRDQAGHGRGYGLAVARELTQRNAGCIDVVSPTSLSTIDGTPGCEVLLLFPRVHCE